MIEAWNSGKEEVERLWRDAIGASEAAEFDYNDRWGKRKKFKGVSWVGKAVELYMEHTEFPSYQIVGAPAGQRAAPSSF